MGKFKPERPVYWCECAKCVPGAFKSGRTWHHHNRYNNKVRPAPTYVSNITEGTKTSPTLR